MATEAPTAPPPSAPAETERGNVPSEPASTHADALGEAFAEMDAAFGEPAAPPASVQQQRKPEPAAPAKPAPAAKTPEKPAERGADGKFLPRKDEPAKPAEAKKPEEPPIEKMAPAQLRKAYEELRRKHSALEEERKKPAETPPSEPQEDPEKKELTERLTAREKRLQDLESELRFTAYERSEEYKEKFEKPFISAWQMGQEQAAKLKIPEQKDDLEEVIQAGRQGTHEDFNILMSKQDDDEAAEWAVKTFGNKASLLLYHRQRVLEANSAKHNALEQFRTNGSEREKQRAQYFEHQTKAVRDLYFKTTTAGIEKYPQFFKPDEADPKTKTLLDKGMRLADRALGAPDAEGEKPLTGEERIKLQAAMRNCFGSFQRLVYDLQKERKTRADLESKLAEYEASTPKGGDGRSAAGGRLATSEEAESPEGAFDAAFGR